MAMIQIVALALGILASLVTLTIFASAHVRRLATTKLHMFVGVTYRIPWITDDINSAIVNATQDVAILQT